MDKQTGTTNPAIQATQARANHAGTATKIELTSPEVPEGSGLPNFVAMGQRTATYWVFVVLAMLVGALITRKMVKDRKFTYKSEAVLIYRGGIDGPPTQDQLKGAATRTKELLLSQNSLKKIIKECRLAPGLEASGNYTPMIEAMRLKIEFKPRAGDTYSLSYEGNSAFEARLVVTKLAEALIDFNAADRKRRLKGSIDFNIAERKKAEEAMIHLQKEVGRFLTEHPTIAGEQLGTGALIKAEIKRKEPAKKTRGGGDGAVARRADDGGRGKRPAAQEKLARADAPPAVDPVLIAAQNAARAELLAARKDLADKSVRYTEQHPDVRAAKARVASAESNLASAEAAVEAAVAAATPPPVARVGAATLADPYADPTPAPRARVAAAPGDPAAPKRAAVSGDPTALIDLDTQWMQLNRDLQKAVQNYMTLDGKVFTAQMADNTDESGYSSELDLLDPATRPSAPTGPPNRSMLSVGFGISIVVGILLAIGFGLFVDQRIYASSEIDDLRIVPVISIIPKGKPTRKPGQSKPWWKLWA
jgi:uncharacterized protein involved in exopolysaccharide biosynthesis